MSSFLIVAMHPCEMIIEFFGCAKASMASGQQCQVLAWTEPLPGSGGLQPQICSLPPESSVVLSFTCTVSSGAVASSCGCSEPGVAPGAS